MLSGQYCTKLGQSSVTGSGGGRGLRVAPTTRHCTRAQEGRHLKHDGPLLLGEDVQAPPHARVGIRVAVLERQRLQLLLDAVQAQQARQRRKHLQQCAFTCQRAQGNFGKRVPGCSCASLQHAAATSIRNSS